MACLCVTAERDGARAEAVEPANISFEVSDLPFDVSTLPFDGGAERAPEIVQPAPRYDFDRNPLSDAAWRPALSAVLALDGANVPPKPFLVAQAMPGPQGGGALPTGPVGEAPQTPQVAAPEL